MKLDFHKTKADDSLFVLNNKTMIILVYVENLHPFGKDINFYIDHIIQNLWDKFWMTN